MCIRDRLTQKQIEDLNAGKAIFVEGMQRKDGEVFSSYVKLDEATAVSYTHLCYRIYADAYHGLHSPAYVGNMDQPYAETQPHGRRTPVLEFISNSVRMKP